jgi:hypothetical protein
MRLISKLETGRQMHHQLYDTFITAWKGVSYIYYYSIRNIARDIFDDINSDLFVHIN